MAVEGVYDCVTESPMGAQNSVLTVTVDGDTIAGTNEGAQGAMDIEEGKVDGNSMTWVMNMTVPNADEAGSFGYRRRRPTDRHGKGWCLWRHGDHRNEARLAADPIA